MSRRDNTVLSNEEASSNRDKETLLLLRNDWNNGVTGGQPGFHRLLGLSSGWAAPAQGAIAGKAFISEAQPSGQRGTGRGSSRSRPSDGKGRRRIWTASYAVPGVRGGERGGSHAHPASRRSP